MGRRRGEGGALVRSAASACPPPPRVPSSMRGGEDDDDGDAWAVYLLPPSLSGMLADGWWACTYVVYLGIDAVPWCV